MNSAIPAKVSLRGRRGRTSYRTSAVPRVRDDHGRLRRATIPRVSAITFRSSDTGPELLPEFLHGRIEMVASASDTPAIPVPEMWSGLPVTPAKLTHSSTSQIVNIHNRKNWLQG